MNFECLDELMACQLTQYIYCSFVCFIIYGYSFWTCCDKTGPNHDATICFPDGYYIPMEVFFTIVIFTITSSCFKFNS